MMGPNPPGKALLANGESGQILPQSMHDTDEIPRLGLCVLHAEVAGKLQLSERLGPTEAAYAMERCLNRITHCARRHSASRTDVFEDRLIASFPAPTLTLLAAREMLERIRALLPMKGIKLTLRAGAVMVRDAEACNEPAENLARNVAELVSDPDGVGDFPGSIALRFAQRSVMQPQFRQGFSAFKLKIADDEIAFGGCWQLLRRNGQAGKHHD